MSNVLYMLALIAMQYETYFGVKVISNSEIHKSTSYNVLCGQVIWRNGWMNVTNCSFSMMFKKIQAYVI